MLTLLQIVRLVSFVSIYGGVEHDSGWVLGTARTLAETGTYATMVSTIVDPTPGGQFNISETYNIQNETGGIYYEPSSIGPSTIIPIAAIIKLFGNGFWQYRSGSLLYLTIALILAACLLYQVGRLLAVVITHLFLFFYPHLIIYLGYEALGEVYGLAYMLLAFVLFNAGLQAERRRWLWFLGAGLAAGFMIVSKLVGLLALSGFAAVCILSFWERRMSFKEVMLIGVSWIGPYLTWELFQFFSIILRFDMQTYQGYKAQIWQYFVRAGSGVNTTGSKSTAFMWEKLLVIQEIASPYQAISVIVFMLILLGGPFLIWRFYRQVIHRNTVIFLWGGWFVTSLWFIVLSQNGWVRHGWYALMLGVFLLSLLTAYFWQHFNKPPKGLHTAGELIITLFIVIGFIGQINAPGFFTPPKVVEQMYQKRLAANRSRIPWVIIPRDQQDATLAVVGQLPASAHIFYPEGFKSAEMAVLSGRIIYPLERRPFLGPTPEDVVLVGPDLISPWAKPMEKPMSQEEREIIVASIEERIKQSCPQIVFENDYYLICALK